MPNRVPVMWTEFIRTILYGLRRQIACAFLAAAIYWGFCFYVDQNQKIRLEKMKAAIAKRIEPNSVECITAVRRVRTGWFYTEEFIEVQRNSVDARD